VNQFTCTNLKSVRLQNLPVKIKYPEMVAEIFPISPATKSPSSEKIICGFCKLHRIVTIICGYKE
jgi:hypothetical protein